MVIIDMQVLEDPHFPKAVQKLKCQGRDIKITTCMVSATQKCFEKLYNVKILQHYNRKNECLIFKRC